ncbi:Uncaracterized surface protein containing fasciclin (FAS1) repeats [Nannocystis exedens]|uniref:Uncaracterized surface protein containing fasciclin (FAS1) repeats n=1 Tax=Nannocystis exedens TaxID=54 RepID=A0A1I2ADT8_9BACT|nr:fasciclin domain-containing protein [Nannocystis exedens]SFE42174.1 Uncaracterized surface protein containing fasciclin (FAS1) repeats [Nannocystis exedens]
MSPRRFAPALFVALALACTRSGETAPPPVDTPPPEPPAVAAEIAPEPQPEAPPEPEAPPAPTLDLLATASEAGGLTTFLSAVDVAGLRETLQGPGPFTIFAPSDKAFAALPKGELDRLLKNKKKLAALLQHHVVAGPPLPGKAYPSAVAPAAEPGAAEPAAPETPPPAVTTLAGAPLPPLPELVRADIQATNGVLHVIDVVLPAPGKAKPAKPAKPASKPAEPASKPARPADPPRALGHVLCVMYRPTCP